MTSLSFYKFFFFLLKKRVPNLHKILDDKSAIYSNKHHYTEIEETCMTLHKI